MTTVLANPIKAQIVTDLQTLIPAGTLGSVAETDLSKDPFAATYTAYPVAIVGMSSVESMMEDDHTNAREYVFPILVLARESDITNPTYMEDLRDAILNVFDTDFTLNGTAIGAIAPATSIAYQASTPDGVLVYFIVTIKAKALYTLGT